MSAVVVLGQVCYREPSWFFTLFLCLLSHVMPDESAGLEIVFLAVCSFLWQCYVVVKFSRRLYPNLLLVGRIAGTGCDCGVRVQDM